MVQITNAIRHCNTVVLDELREKGIKCWIAGGWLRDYFAGKPIKTDCDLFFPDAANYQLCYDYMKTIGEITWESDNGCKVNVGKRTFDLIKIFFPSPQATIDNFDFTIAMFACDGLEIYTAPTSWMDLAKRQLMTNRLDYPRSTMSRVLRYQKKGYSICQEELQKIILAIENDAVKSYEIRRTNEIILPLTGANGNATAMVQAESEKPPSGNNNNFFTGID